MSLKVTIEQTIATEWTPYTVTYSDDGKMLAYGDGFYYGSGNIVCLNTAAGSVIAGVALKDVLTGNTNERAATVSGLCFDRTGGYLAASLWSASHGYAPGMLFKIEGEQIGAVSTYRDAPGTLAQLNIINNRGYATGVALSAGKLIVRRNAVMDLSLTAFDLDRPVDTAGVSLHRTSARLAILPGAIATGFHHTEHSVGRRSITSGLLLKKDGDGDSSLLPMPHEISAITASHDGATLVTGGHDGSIAVWRYAEGLEVAMMRQLPPCSEARCQSRPIGTHIYRGCSIVAACFLSDADVFATAEASGHLRVWHDDNVVNSWFVEGGSPRSIAAHPAEPLLAVACKSVDDNSKVGKVEIYNTGVSF